MKSKATPDSERLQPPQGPGLGTGFTGLIVDYPAGWQTSMSGWLVCRYIECQGHPSSLQTMPPLYFHLSDWYPSDTWIHTYGSSIYSCDSSVTSFAREDMRPENQQLHCLSAIRPTGSRDKRNQPPRVTAWSVFDLPWKNIIIKKHVLDFKHSSTNKKLKLQINIWSSVHFFLYSIPKIDHICVCVFLPKRKTHLLAPGGA